MEALNPIKQWAYIAAKTGGGEFYNRPSKGIPFRIATDSSPDIGMARPAKPAGMKGVSFNSKLKGKR